MTQSASRSNKGEKLYMVRTRVFAKNAAEALKRAKEVAPHEAYLDADWEKHNITAEDAIGFRT